jgi:hypothetical protein
MSSPSLMLEGVIANKPVLGTIFEVQLERKERKRYTWPLYAVAARARHECPFVLTVVTPDPAVARWAGRSIELGNGVFVPRVIGPEGIPRMTDRDQAVREPQLAVLSVIAHGGSEVASNPRRTSRDGRRTPRPHSGSSGLLQAMASASRSSSRSIRRRDSSVSLPSRNS